MPEMLWTIRWPDGAEEALYSPSTIISAHVSPGSSYPLPEFMTRARAALHAASARVAARHGFPCSAAMGQLARLEEAARAQSQDGSVTCLSIRPKGARP